MSIINHDYVGEKTMSGKIFKRFAKEYKKIFSEILLSTILEEIIW